MSWRDDAACLGTDTDLWFATDHANGAPHELVATCQACPVRDACLTDAIRDNDVFYGVRAGLTPTGRRRWAARQGIAVASERDARCGTPSGYSRHSRAGEPTCKPCRAARREQRRAAAARRRPTPATAVSA